LKNQRQAEVLLKTNLGHIKRNAFALAKVQLFVCSLFSSKASSREDAVVK